MRLSRLPGAVALFLCAALALPAGAATGAAPVGREVALERLQGFDGYMDKLLGDWNGVGFGVAVVVGDELVYAKGYGYRDYGRKLPVTSATLFPIASNTKLFGGVQRLPGGRGQLAWDAPVRQSVPTIRFYDDELDRTVTLRDMLAHRTGVTRHDAVWAYNGLNAETLFERLRYLEPSEPLRQKFLYNNLMYAAAGHIVSLKAGKPWKQFVQEKILQPLDMRSTVFSIAEMTERPDHGVRLTPNGGIRAASYQRPYYEDTGGIAPAGAMISKPRQTSLTG